MSYDVNERSEQAAAPVELYTFARTLIDSVDPCNTAQSSTVLYRYTSAEADVTIDGDLYTAAPITRSAIEATPEQARNALTLNMPRNLAIADLFRIHPPTDVITLTIRRYHRDDAEGSPLDIAAIWMGRVLNVAWQGAQATMNCEPVSTSLRRPGLRRLYQKQCPHVLYGPACGAARVGVPVTVAAISGSTITVSGLDAGNYAGGFVERETETGIFDRRFIRAMTGGSPADGLVLTQPFQGLSVSDALTVYLGCDHTMNTCNAVFDNLPNYGGFPFIPTKNPFGGDPVY